MRTLLLLAFGTFVAGCYPHYTKMEPVNEATPQYTHKEVISAPSYTAGPTQETTHTPSVAPFEYHN